MLATVKAENQAQPAIASVMGMPQFNGFPYAATATAMPSAGGFAVPSGPGGVHGGHMALMPPAGQPNWGWNGFP